jgi:hypothetical protein
VKKIIASLVVLLGGVVLLTNQTQAATKVVDATVENHTSDTDAFRMKGDHLTAPTQAAEPSLFKLASGGLFLGLIGIGIVQRRKKAVRQSVKEEQVYYLAELAKFPGRHDREKKQALEKVVKSFYVTQALMENKASVAAARHATPQFRARLQPDAPCEQADRVKRVFRVQSVSRYRQLTPTSFSVTIRYLVKSWHPTSKRQTFAKQLVSETWFFNQNPQGDYLVDFIQN